MNNFYEKIYNIINKRKINRKLTAIFVVFAVIVSQIVSICLIRPAESQTSELICGLSEHEHNENCYQLVCSYEDPADEDQIAQPECCALTEDSEENADDEQTGSSHYELICTRPEHTHDESCRGSEDTIAEEAEEAADTATVLPIEISDSENADEEKIADEEITEISEPEMFAIPEMFAMVKNAAPFALNVNNIDPFYINFEDYYIDFENVTTIDELNASTKVFNFEEFTIEKATGNIFNKEKCIKCIKDNSNTDINKIVFYAPCKGKIEIKMAPNGRGRFIYNDDEGENKCDTTTNTLTLTVAEAQNVKLVQREQREIYSIQFIPDIPQSSGTQPTKTNTEIKIEARLIFGDYKDIEQNDRNFQNPDVQNLRYQENVYRLPFQLNSRSGGIIDYAENIAMSNLVEDETAARKDWCYQYNYEWTVDQIQSNNNDGYYITLPGTENGLITIKDCPTLAGTIERTFKVYYLKDDTFGHPGNARNTDFETTASEVYSNDNQIFYIFLDPVVDYDKNGKLTNPNAKIEISMKKRWDGYNDFGIGGSNAENMHKKEKIIVQLQFLNSNGEWEKCDSKNLGGYDFVTNFSIIDPNENNRTKWSHFVDKSVTDGNDVQLERNAAGSIIYKGVTNGTDYTNRLNDYTTLKNNNKLDPTVKENRLQLHIPDTEWNDVTLTLDGKNNPSHFTEGYYYAWSNLPMNQYRVVELKSFYDVNDNDRYNAGIDRDTSQDYYYTSFPPSRNSSGILHIQNFTKYMSLEVQKEWYDDDKGTKQITGENRKIEFEIYCSSTPIADPNHSNLTKIGGTFTTNDNGYALITNNNAVTTNGRIIEPELKPCDPDGNKYYYYIREVGVVGLAKNQYQLINGNGDRFVEASTGKYYVDYESGDARKFIIKNQLYTSIRIEKQWEVAANTYVGYDKISGSLPETKFEIYKCKSAGTPTKVNGEFKVNDEVMTKIGSDVINENGEFVFNKGNTGNELNVNGNVYELYAENGGFVQTKNGTKINVDNVNNGFDIPSANDQKPIIKDDIMEMSSTNRLIWVKSREPGTLVLKFKPENAGAGVKFTKGNNSTYEPSLDPNVYTISDDGTLTIPNWGKGSNVRMLRSGNQTLYLEKATFIAGAYYYIREVPSPDNYELVNTLKYGDEDLGFVKIGNNYFLSLANDNAPTVTAKNNPKMKLNIKKEWYSSNANMNNPTKKLTIQEQVNLEIYKSYTQGTPEKKGNEYFVNNEKLEISGEYQTDNQGKLTKELDAFDPKNDGTYQKIYYYVRETDSDTYSLLNGSDGFVTNGNGKYGTSFYDANDNNQTVDKRTFTFKNKPVLDLTVIKEWQNSSGETDQYETRDINFILLSSTTKYNDPTIKENGNKYYIGTTELTEVKNNNKNNWTTNNLRVTIDNLPAYNDNDNKLLYYYVLEIDGDDYYVRDCTTSYLGQGICRNGQTPEIKVTNKRNPQSYTLPETGGKGTRFYTVIGAAMIILSIGAFAIKRRKCDTK